MDSFKLGYVMLGDTANFSDLFRVFMTVCLFDCVGRLFVRCTNNIIF